jgi:peptidoglycan/LPS O-acetylase OafA/YrhL
MDTQPGRDRVFGLDLMRAIAILWVLLSHGDDLLDAHWPARPGLSGFDGVDLFFVLSGYLVGGILLRQLERPGQPWFRKLLDFWQRRWLRTLPNYVLFLLVNIALVFFGLAPGLLNVNALAYFVFLQNLWVPLDLFFWESWSLAVEEWFYVLFPLLAMAAMGMARGGVRSGYLLAAVIMVCVPVLLRHAVPVPTTLFEADLHFRKIVLMRLDGIGWGALAVWFHTIRPNAWVQWRWPLFVGGVAGLVWSATLIDADHLPFVARWSYTASALSMAMLLPMLSTWTSTPWWGRPVVGLSLISYALYLVHMPLRHLLHPLALGAGMAGAMAVYAGWWLACVLLATVVYRAWELPFLRMRDRLGRRIGVSGPSA